MTKSRSTFICVDSDSNYSYTGTLPEILYKLELREAEDDIVRRINNGDMVFYRAQQIQVKLTMIQRLDRIIETKSGT